MLMVIKQLNMIYLFKLEVFYMKTVIKVFLKRIGMLNYMYVVILYKTQRQSNKLALTTFLNNTAISIRTWVRVLKILVSYPTGKIGMHYYRYVLSIQIINAIFYVQAKSSRFTVQTFQRLKLSHLNKNNPDARSNSAEYGLQLQLHKNLVILNLKSR